MSDEFKHFDKHQRKIIDLLFKIRIKQSTLAIAKRLQMHWTTAEEALEQLEGKQWVIKEEMGNKSLWQFNFERYEEENKLIHKS
jgi:Mn-dependent DtxR family transcriptional regulator